MMLQLLIAVFFGLLGSLMLFWVYLWLFEGDDWFGDKDDAKPADRVDPDNLHS